jgi:uncharacterized delta-60 repeat protein
MIARQLRFWASLLLLGIATVSAAEPDATFQPGTGVDGTVTCIVPLTSGQILISGLFQHYNGTSRPGLALIATNGGLEADFSPQLTVPAGGGVFTVAIDPQGRIYVGGNFTAVGGTARPGLARLNGSGALDSTFNPNLPAGTSIAAIAFAGDGGIYVGGNLTHADSSTSGIALRKLLPTGEVDSSFTAPGMGAYDYIPFVYKLVVLPDGRLLVGGEFSSVAGANQSNICRLRADGTRDSSFTASVPLVWTQISDIDVMPDGRAYLSGDYIMLNDFSPGCIGRVTASGAADTSFSVTAADSTGGNRAIVNNVQVLPDGRLIAVGNFRTVNDAAYAFLFRTFDDGTIDTSFTSTTDNEVVAIAQDGQGRLLIGGSFSKVNTTAAPGIARLSRAGDAPLVRAPPGPQKLLQGANLVIDPKIIGADSVQWYKDGVLLDGITGPKLAFVSATTADAGVYTFKATNSFATTTGQSIPVVVTPLAPGALDPSFSGTVGPFGHTDWRVTLRADGTWAAVEGGNAPKLHLYDSNFAPTQSWRIQGIKQMTPERIVSDSKQRIWVIGSAILDNSTTRRLVRLLPDGVLDSTYDVGASLYAWSKIVPQSDGSAILLAGQYDTQLTRLLPSGTIDPTFTRSAAWTFAVQPDGRIVYGWGVFGGYTLQVARVLADGSPDSTFSTGTVTGNGRRGAGTVVSTVHDLMVLPSGDIIAAAGGPLAYTAVVWLTSTGTARGVYSSKAENGRIALLGYDNAGAVYAAGSGLGCCRVSAPGVGVSYPDLSDMHDDVLGTWSSADGLIVTYPPYVNIGMPSPTPRTVKILTANQGSFRLANLSSRGAANDGEDSIIMGFVLSSRVPCLVRAVGPSLANFNVPGVDPDPMIELFQGRTAIGQSDNWNSNDATLIATSARAGAFELPAGSKDAAMLPTLDAGGYTTIVHSQGHANGVVLGEVYETASGDARLSNLSLRGRVGSADAALIAGFVVTGDSPRWVLIRAIGPGLLPFGVQSVLTDPKLVLARNGTPVFENDNWSSGSDATLIEAAARKVGAFALKSGSLDAALLISLAPGDYTALVTGANGGTGPALIEVYGIDL